MESPEQVVLVDKSDGEVGTSEKIAAHRDDGRLHRSFSIFLLDNDGRLLLQQRSLKKYHFKGLWSNACCGHPRPAESVADAAARRLREEIGAVTSLVPLFSFVYFATDRYTGYTEREYDHVLLGRFDGQLVPCPEEVDDLRWASPAGLVADMRLNAGCYTPWFLLAAPRVLSAVARPGIAKAEGKPPKAEGEPRVSTTDLEARVMTMADGRFRPAFNPQLAVDTAMQLIAGVDLANIGSDMGQMVPMHEQIEQR